MRIISVSTLVCPLLVMSVMLTAIAVLSSLGEPTEIRIEDLESGRLLPMFTGQTLWKQYPAIPMDPPLSIDWYAAAFAPGVVAFGVSLSRSRQTFSLRAIAIASLAAGIIPYTIGGIALRISSHSASECGGWLSFMMNGVLYSACVSLIWSSMGFYMAIAARFRITNVAHKREATGHARAGTDHKTVSLQPNS